MGHSMVDTVVDISLPTHKHFCRHHHVDSPSARFDHPITAINQIALITADTRILSLCGGATNLMAPGALLSSISEPPPRAQSRHISVANAS